MTRRGSIIGPLAALALSAWIGAAAAQLGGEYGGVRSRLCMNSSDYDANLALVGSGSVSSTSEASVITLNLDGTVTSQGSALSIFHGATGTGATPAVEFTFTCSATYSLSVVPTRRITVSGTSCISTAQNGPNAGAQTEVTGQVIEYELLDGDRVLSSEETAPHVETLRNLATGATSERVCHRAATRFFLR